MRTLLTLLMSSLIMFASAQTIPNAGFEQATDTFPEKWAFDPIGSAVKSDYAHSGNSSLVVWNWYYYATGWVVNGSFPANSLESPMRFGNAGTPIDQKYDRLTGFYRYDSTGSHSPTQDSAYIAVLFKKFNAGLQRYDTIGFGEAFLLPTDASDPGFQPFTLEINDLMPFAEPDSVAILIQSSVNGFCQVSGSGNCLYLYVDDLAFEKGGVVSTNDINSLFESVTMYPNPTSDQVTITSREAVSVLLHDVIGRLQLQQLNPSTQHNLNIDHLAKGMYVVSLYKDNELVTRKKLVKE